MNTTIAARRALFGLLVSVFLVSMIASPRVGTSLAQTSGLPTFSRNVPSDTPLATCVQGHFEPSGSTPHAWLIKSKLQQAGQVTIEVIAHAVNPVEESGSITAQLFQGTMALGSPVTVFHPTGSGVPIGADSPPGLISFQAQSNTVYTLLVSRGPAISTPREAHHYKLGFSQTPVNVGIASPAFHFLEAEDAQHFFVNVDQGEGPSLRVFADSLPPGGGTFAEVTVTRPLLPPAVFGPSALPFTITLPAGAAGTLRVDVDTDGHFQLDKVSGSDRGVYFDRCGRTRLPVPADIKPQSCPNPINTNDRGVLPVAILGTATFDVTQINQSSIRMAGVAPLVGRNAFEDVATPFVPFTEKSNRLDCTPAGPDGFLDLTMKFDAQQVVQGLETRLGRPLADGEVLTLKIKGVLVDTTPFVGKDVVFVIRKK